jgi:signal transduction histidine kinase
MENTLNEILSQCQRLSKAIEGIVEFARPNKVNYEYFKLNSLISRSIFLIRQEMDFNGIEIMNEIPINLPRIYGNRIQLEQVFIHLFRLSHHTLQGHGKILIKGKIEPKVRAIAIDYIDNRLSISSEDFKRILSHFFAHKHDHMSTGLYVTHKIIQSLGGKMIIDEDKDGRNVIRIHLFYKNQMKYMPTDKAQKEWDKIIFK